MKKLFAYLTTFVIIFTLLMLTVHASAEDGIAFTTADDYRTESIMTELPITIEAEIKFPADQTIRGGVIVGNMVENGHAGLTIEIMASGAPRVIYLDNTGYYRDFKFNNVNVFTGEWVNLTMVLDNSTNTMYAYVNGELVQTRTSCRYSREPLNFRDAMVVGSDNRAAYHAENPRFTGRMRELLIYDDLRTASEIASDYTSATIDIGNLVAAYRFSENQDGTNPGTITDLSGNGYNLVSTAPFAKNEVTTNPYAYGMAVLGDTQLFINADPIAYKETTEWIGDPANKIKHAFRLGGVVAESQDLKGWNYALEDVTLFNLGTKVPYSVVRGYADSVEDFNLSFSTKRHGAAISGAYDDTMMNTYSKFEVGNVKYLVLSLDFEASDDVLNWASAICAANPDRNVIIATHENLAFASSVNGQNFWNKLIKKHSNISLVLCSDVVSKKVNMTTKTGDNGNKIVQIAMPRLSHNNYATEGFIGMLYFSENGENVQFRFYSPTEDEYLMDENQFAFTLDTVAYTADSLSEFTVTAAAAKSEYTVSINADENATITLTDTVVAAGASTTFTVEPKFGYHIESITVGGTAIEIGNAYQGGTYSTGAINKDTAIVVIMAPDELNITETNDYGTVIAEVGGTEIKVVADEGFYLYSATINGQSVTFTKPQSVYESSSATYTAQDYELSNSATAMNYKEVWTYTLPEGVLTAADEIVITYGVYEQTLMLLGGDAEAAMGTAEQQFDDYQNAGNVTIVDTENNGGNHAFYYTGSRLVSKSIPWTPGKYIVKWDMKSTADATVRLTAPGSASHVSGARADRNYLHDIAVPTTWKSYTVYMDIVADLTSSYVYFRDITVPAYVDNIYVAKLAEGGIAPTYHNINVTETNDYGVVTASAARIESAESVNIEIVADTGYYVHSVTLNGTDITESFTKAYALQNTTTAWCYTEKWTAAIAGNTIIGDANIVITYGKYNLDHMYNGGDAETPLGTIGQDFGSYSNNNNVTITDAENNGGSHSFTFNSSRLTGKTIDWTSGKYLIKFDVKAATSDSATMAVYTMSGATVNGTTRSYVPADYFKFGTTWKTITIYMDLTVDKSGVIDLRNPSDTIYVDNIVVTKLSEGGVPAPAPTTATVTINTDANANTSVAAGTVAIGGETTFTVVPKFGYYIQSITIGGESFVGFDAYKGGTYSTGAINADTAIVVTTASYAANDKGVSTDVATLPSVFADNAADSAVTFGKVLDTTNATSWGIELTKDGVGVTPYHGGSYLYKANSTSTSGQYAIEFIGLEAGEYTIRSYVYVNGVAEFGAPSTFVVE